MAIKKSKGLGKGLDSLIPSGGINIAPVSEEVKKAEVYVNITKIEPNRDQPRKEFDEEALAGLSESIKEHGVIEPLIVQDRGGIITNNHLDVWMESESQCINFGRRNLECYIYE